MANRREILKSYFVEVARDLVARGVIRRAQGQSLEAVVRAEYRVVLQHMSADLVAVGRELGVGFLQGGATMIENSGHPLAGIMSASLKALADAIIPPKKR